MACSLESFAASSNCGAVRTEKQKDNWKLVFNGSKMAEPFEWREINPKIRYANNHQFSTQHM